jgi:hypothetical protein
MNRRPNINTAIAGRRYGHLVTSYAVHEGRRIALRCICGRFVFAAAADLNSGLLTSCGCQPMPRAFRYQLHNLRAQLKREIQFDIARRRS